MGLFNFSGIRDALSGVKVRITDLDSEILKVQKKLADLVSLPLPYDDFVEWAIGRYDELASEFPAELRRELLSSEGSMRNFYMARRDGHDSLDAFNAVFMKKCPVPFERPANYMGNSYPMTDRAFFFFFRDQIKESVRRALDEVVKPEWPAVVGLPRADRVPQIQKLEAHLENLISERDSIRSELNSVVGTEGA